MNKIWTTEDWERLFPKKPRNKEMLKEITTDKNFKAFVMQNFLDNDDGRLRRGESRIKEGEYYRKNRNYLISKWMKNRCL